MGDFIEHEQVYNTDKKGGNLVVLKVLSPLFLALILVFLISSMLNSLGGENAQLSFAFWYSLIYIIFGTFGFLFSMVCPIIGIVLTLTRKEKGKRQGQLIYFIILTALPVVLWLCGIFILPKIVI